MKPALVVGIGNLQAGDDGAGLAIAERFDGQPGVIVKITHQLTPELAAEVAAAGQVIFVDAAPVGRAVCVEALAPGRPDSALSHVSSPQAILELARLLYGRVPPAHLVTIRGQRFDHGVGLSAPTRRRIPAALRAVGRLLRMGPDIVRPT
jgi:hydrogenase maturation protease